MSKPNRAGWLIVIAIAALGIATVAMPVTASAKHSKKHKKKHKKSGTVVFNQTLNPNTVIPDRPSLNGIYGKASQAFAVDSKAFSGKAVTDVEVTVKTLVSGVSEYYLAAPSGPIIRLVPDIGLFYSGGPFTFTRHSTAGVCTYNTSCSNPLQTIKAPSWAGAASTSYLAILNGLPMTGTWTLWVFDAEYNNQPAGGHLQTAGLRIVGA